MQLFYSADIKNNFCVLNEEESRHCIQVLRHAEGDFISVFDGKGQLFKAIILEAHPKKCSIQVVETLVAFGKHPYYLHIAMAPTKNMDRFEWFVEKAVEIGVDEITPIICEHSERKIIKMDRVDKVVMAAMKQSLNIVRPKLNEPMTFNLFLDKAWRGTKLIAHCELGDKLFFKQALALSTEMLLLIGPEGDFSKLEIESALNNGYQAVSLGESRLRTETAGLLACAAAATLYSQP